mmetsp:Transcript_30318/g.69894  ORF Transcript_30318/g.69894 Transcript_30318/m.69894 type:complete len:155 (+) Transcript_30318:1001-1465(+)
MQVVLDDDRTIEFTNIHREELSVLDAYIHSILIPAMRRDVQDNHDDHDDHGPTAVELTSDELVQVIAEPETREVEIGYQNPQRVRSRRAFKESHEATKAQLEQPINEEEDDDDEDDADYKMPENYEEDDDDETESEEDDEVEVSQPPSKKVRGL